MNRLIVCLFCSLLAAPALADTPNDTVATDSDQDFASGLTLDSRLVQPPHYRPRRSRLRRVKVNRAQPEPTLPSNFGPYLTFGGLGHFVIDDASTTLDNAYQGGGGFIVGIGFRLLPMLALEANWMASFQSTAVQTTLGSMPVNAIHSLNLDAKVFFLPWSQRIEPYVQLGIGAYMLSESFAYELSGFGFDIGGGVDIRFTDSIGLGLKVLYRGFYVDNTADNYYVYLQREAAFIDSITTEATLQFYF